jgi:hypothetical protein
VRPAFLLTAALAACAPQGPSHAQAQAALTDYFAGPHTYPVDVAGAELRGATLVSFGDCNAMAPTFTCQASFDQNGRRIATRVTIAERDNAWFVESVHPL